MKKNSTKTLKKSKIIESDEYESDDSYESTVKGSVNKKTQKDDDNKPVQKNKSKQNIEILKKTDNLQSKKSNKYIINNTDECIIPAVKKEVVNTEQKYKKILEIKTTQTAALKQAFEMVSNVISECCIVFIPPDENTDAYIDNDYDDIDNDQFSNIKNKSKNINQNVKKNTGGIRILRLTQERTILIKLNLDACNFEQFICLEQKITIGVDMNQLHALLKTISDDNTIYIYMNDDNRSALYIRSVNEKEDSSEETDIELFLMDISNPEVPITQTEFQGKITMASDKFHSICKHLNNNSTFVEITSVSNQISFKGKSEGGKVTMSYKDINGPVSKIVPPPVVQGLYELKNLMSFSKCNKLCTTIDLYLKNDYPLVLVIAAATLGKLYIFFSPSENGNL